jgi:hypothetical protein
MPKKQYLADCGIDLTQGRSNDIAYKISNKIRASIAHNVCTAVFVAPPQGPLSR